MSTGPGSGFMGFLPALLYLIETFDFRPDSSKSQPSPVTNWTIHSDTPDLGMVYLENAYLFCPVVRTNKIYEAPSLGKGLNQQIVPFNICKLPIFVRFQCFAQISASSSSSANAINRSAVNPAPFSNPGRTDHRDLNPFPCFLWVDNVGMGKDYCFVLEGWNFMSLGASVGFPRTGN